MHRLRPQGAKVLKRKAGKDYRLRRRKINGAASRPSQTSGIRSAPAGPMTRYDNMTCLIFDDLRRCCPAYPFVVFAVHSGRLSGERGSGLRIFGSAHRPTLSTDIRLQKGACGAGQGLVSVTTTGPQPNPPSSPVWRCLVSERVELETGRKTRKQGLNASGLRFNNRRESGVFFAALSRASSYRK